MTTSIKAEQLARLRAVRDDIARRTGVDRAEKLRKQREEEAMDDYNWKRYTSAVAKRAGRGAR